MSPSAARPARKRRDHYHHGDLRRALVMEAVRTIDADGVAGLTLRAVGQRLGVSRTALYRHFADKSALLAAVGREGFRTFREELEAAVRSEPDGWRAFEAMGQAYVHFAMTRPSHYRVMFGGFLEACKNDPDLLAEAEGSFRVLVDSLIAQQRAGILRDDDPEQMARYVWAIVHGISMLAIDGQLRDHETDAEVRYAIARLATGLRRSPAGEEQKPTGALQN